jgi:tetratricopeptide (TPR) repeat protein
VPKSRPRSSPKPSTTRPKALYLSLLLFLSTLALYAPVRTFDFINFDDPDYVTANPHVRHSLTPETLQWALASGEAANWFPVTRLSHLLDVQFFGVDAGWHHLTNAFIHALAALFLFAFLRRASGTLWPSAFVAFLFALHPLHVESVAWVSERKDVLSAFFWFLTLWCYVRYTERPGTARYLLTLASFALGLTAKPMIVTLPFVLLLIDFWPLRRGHRIREKLPFLALSAAASIMTFLVQRGSGAVQVVEALPIGLRIENALISYVLYLGKTVWPSGLAVFYPYPAAWPIWQAALALCAVVLVSILVWRRRQIQPWLAVGWFWFLGTLLPVIGLVQVGAQARADRYMYVPMVGLSIMLAWSAAQLAIPRNALRALAVIACLALAAVTWAQLPSWRNSEALFRHAIDVTGENYLAEHNLGVALLDQPGKLPEALNHLTTAVRLQPNSAKAHTDLGNALSQLPGRLPEAISEYQTALRLKPDDPRIPTNLGRALSKAGRVPEAIAQFQSALHIDPDYAQAHNNLGSALAEMPGRSADAITEFQTAVRLNPDYAEARDNLATALAADPARFPDTLSQYEAALRAHPDNAEAHNNLGTALSNLPGRLPEAISHFEAAVRLNPASAEMRYNLGAALSRMDGRLPDAISQLEAAIRIKPDYPEAHNNLGVALSTAGRQAEAIQQFRTAVRLKPDYEDARYNLKLAESAAASTPR